MKRIKILFVLEATIGGTYTHVMFLVKNLSRKEFDISIILSPIRSTQCIRDAEILEKSGIKCFFIPMVRRISVINDFKATIAICRCLKKESFDIVHTHSSKAGIIGRFGAFLYKVPCIIYTPHCYFFQGKRGLQKNIFKKLEQIAALATNYLITVSQSERLLTQSEKVISSKKNVTIHNAIDVHDIPSIPSRDTIKKKYEINSINNIVTMVGRFAPQKDWQTSILIANEVLKEFKNVIFIVAGSGEEEIMINKLINKYGLSENIVMTGYTNDINEIYSITDVFLNTSLWEGMSYTILEAMYFSVPIVASDVPGNNDIIVHGENGYLFEKKNILMGAAKVLSLLKNEIERVSMGKKGHDYVIKNHDLKEFICKHEQLYFRSIKRL